MVKRQNPFAQYAAPSSDMAKRLRRVEQMALSNRHEMKNKAYGLNGAVAAGTLTNVQLTGIARGDAVNERIGNAIKVWRIEVRGQCVDELDQFILQGHDTTGPSATDFTPNIGAMIVDNQLNSYFTEWRHYQNVQGGASFKFVVKFKKGITVKYGGATVNDCSENLLHWSVLNRDTTGRAINATCRVWYTDG